MKLFKRIALLIFLLLLAVTVASVMIWREISTPYQGFSGEAVFVEVERGMSTARIAQLLQEEGVLQSAWHLQAARLLPPRAVLQAGEYRFAGAASALDVVDRLHRGDVYYVTLKVPEGLNLWELAVLVDQSELKRATGFLAVARNPELIRDLAPAAQSLEGYLFPSTYLFRRNTSAREICERLTGEFRRQWQSLKNTEPSSQSNNVHEIVTMASLVEKESSIPEERPLVSSVFWNRLREGIKLDCDPTVIYAALLENRYRGTIYLSDLQREHPYNTYQRRGMPPGPIASPGLESLRAALNPAESPYIFFVAKGDGSGAHRFSENLAAHERAVKAYRDAIQQTETNRGNTGNRR